MNPASTDSFINATPDTLGIVRRVTGVGAAVNLALAAVKLAIGWAARSQALLADGVHSLSDLVTDAALLVGVRFWSAEPDARHPYGHGRIETTVSLSIATALVAVSVGIVWRAWITMNTVQVDPPGWAALAAAVVSIVAKEALYRWTLAAGKKSRCRALTANAWHHRSDALSSIPVAVAVIGSRVLPGFAYLDNIAAVMVAILLLRAAWSIARPCVSEFMEAQCDADLDGVLTSIRQQYPAIREIHKVRCRRVGGAMYVDLHMLVDATMSVGDSHELAENVKRAMMTGEPAVQDVTVHTEPASEVISDQ